jgi:isoquinoline 1-oxidoreductase beta subunit
MESEPSPETAKLTRRDFIKVGVVAWGASSLSLIVTSSPSAAPDAKSDAPARFKPNLWVQIGSDNRITIFTTEAEMGQGVHTSLGMILADELDANFQTVRVEQAPVTLAYGYQSTGGSSSVRTHFEPLRHAGAVARDMLLAAAATAWKVSKNECRTENGMVLHTKSSRQLSYGELAQAASALPVPKDVSLKSDKNFRLIGKPIKRLDAKGAITGETKYAIDIQLPGMLTAVIAHPPVFGGALETFDDKKTRAVPGVKAVVPIDSGIAVVADTYWNARKGLEALAIEWKGGDANTSSGSIRQQFIEDAKRKPTVARREGNLEAAWRDAAQTLDAVYELPFQAHATMEPMCSVARIEGRHCEVWAPTQSPSRAQYQAVKHAFGFPFKTYLDIKRRMKSELSSYATLHTTPLGGGFGRRLQQDFVTEVVQIAKAVGRPVKLIWSREEDLQHDYYRPASYHVLRGALDGRGRLSAWSHRVVAPSIDDYLEGPSALKDGLANMGGASNLPYAIGNVDVNYVLSRTPVPLGFWRSVDNSINGFVVESFIDELAHAANLDPYRFRRELLADKPKHLAVLDLAAKKSGWDQALPAGRFRGIAVHEAFRSFCAQVAEVSVGKDGAVTVHRVVVAIECGRAVNPGGIAQQVESSVVFGLTAALKSEITIEKGRVKQSNFHDFPLLRLNETPIIETHIVPSVEPPRGVGEPAVPPVAPAVANAIFAATGKRVRKLPITPQDLRTT